MTDDKKKLIYLVCAGLAIGLFLKLFVVDILHVSGRSMYPTIKDGESLVVNKLAYGIIRPYGEKLLLQWAKPQRDDIVIFLYNNKIVVKRCLATGGETLAYSDNSVYTLHVGDKNIPLTESQWQNLRNIDSVPEGYILAIGDNYEESVDSRTYGFVSERNILGKVICR